MKILVIGGSGLLGKKLQEVLVGNEFDVYASFHQNPMEKKNTFQLDITQRENVLNIFKKISPEVVILAAAYTDVDGCEKNKDKAFLVNVEGTKNVANSVEKMGIKLVYVSTDYVFDGEKGLYKEEDPTNPINYYGRTKLDGEDVVKTICSQYIIARTSVIYGSNKRNFVTWVIEKLKDKEPIRIVTDQFVSPTLNIDLAEQILGLINKDVRGIFHTAGGQRISRYEFCRVIADVFGLDKTLITPVKMEDMSWIAKRPVDSSLDISKISRFKKPYIVKEAVQMLQEDMER